MLDSRPKIQGLRSDSGFTLLELLISMTILALIFVAVLGAIRIGTRSWERGEARAEENQRTRALVESLAHDLTMIYPLRVKDQDRDVIVFHGKSDSLEFATLPQSYGAEPFSHMIRIVAYGIESDRGLTATASYPLVTQTSGSVESRAKLLDERVSEVRFRYLVPAGKPGDKLPPTWRDFWDPAQEESFHPFSAGFTSTMGQRALKGSDRLPLAVEVTLTIRHERAQGVRELTLPPLVFPVQVGRML